MLCFIMFVLVTAVCVLFLITEVEMAKNKSINNIKHTCFLMTNLTFFSRIFFTDGLLELYFGK